MLRLLSRIRQMMPTTKRPGSELERVEQEVMPEGNTLTTQACIWGIEKYFDQKQCYKHFVKYFGQQDLTHLCKYKNKPFYLVRFMKPINIEAFNSENAKNKRVKIKPIQQNMQVIEEGFITIEECVRVQEKKQAKATEEEIEAVRNIDIRDIVQPLHKLPYEEQVQTKVKNLTRVIENYNRAYFKDTEVSRLQKSGIEQPPLKMQQFVECKSKRDSYRSKSQFTIGRNEKGQAVIGFNKGSYHNGTIMVQSPRNVSIISRNTKLVVAVVEQFIRNNFLELQPYDRVIGSGFWRYMVVRQSQRTKQILIVLVCRTAEVQPEELAKFKDELTQCLRKSIIGLVSFCFLSYNGEADCVPTEKPELLFGKPYYEQVILGHTFQVSPSAFLQIHIDMFEVLAERIIQAVSECDIVLDLGCGIGSIGISIQRRLPQVKVIGIQICAEAVEDAKRNSQSYQVHLGRAQDLIKDICEQHRGKRIVAILDPPRAGFNKEVMVALRRCRGLDNVIYVACNAGAIQDNLLQLTLPMTDKRKAPEFTINNMTGFDLFPQTNHYEAFYVLKRIG